MALTAAGAIASSQAQPFANYIADQFDTDTTGNLQNQGWGTAAPVIAWSTDNAITTMGPNNSGSGSAEFQIGWVTSSGDQVMVARWFPATPTSDYTNVSFDIKFDPASAVDANGVSYGAIDFGCIPTSAGWPSTSFGVWISAITNGNGWQHVVIPISSSEASQIGPIEGYAVKVKQNDSGSPLPNGGTTTFYLDNVIFGGNTNLPPPPTLSIARNTSPSGLLLMCSGNASSYNRQILMAFDPVNTTRNFSWIGSPNPVTYSQTIVSYPDANHPIESEIFLVPNGQFGDSGVDYDAANEAQLAIFGNANGSATGSFQCKANEPDGNGMWNWVGVVWQLNVASGGSGYTSAPSVTISGTGTGATATAQISSSGEVTNLVVTAGGSGYTDGTTVTFSGGGGSGAAATATAWTGNIGSLTAPSAVGTWSLAFQNDTNVTISYVPLSGSGGISTNFNVPGQDVAAGFQTYFANPLTVYMGNQQNGPGAADGNVGQYSTYSEFKISGVTASPSLDDVWSRQTVLDTTNWGEVAYANNMLLVHSTDKYWVKWTLPDQGFALAVSTNLAAGTNGWMNASPSQIVVTANANEVLLPALMPSYPTNSPDVFMSLVRRNFTQLQVLLPGETNAPNTASGYIGSPTPISLSGASSGLVSVTINACDATWHIVASAPSDTISLASTDSGAGLPVPAALASGSLQASVQFADQGSWTVTATDTTAGAISAATSAPVMVGP
jgi:hypothetical protein